MLLTTDELMQVDLTGFMFYQREKGYTMTARNGDIFTEYVVVSDNGKVVTYKEDGWIPVSVSKDMACRLIADRPIYEKRDGEIFNKIVNI
jgi:hypothetical protein